MANKYPTCKHTQRLPQDSTKVTKEIVDGIGSAYRVLPMFEKSLNEYNTKKYYSLKNNDFLNCRWIEYVNTVDKAFRPLQFPTTSDEHFYNNMCRLVPSQSLKNNPSFRYKLGPGPGVDARGLQKPIPQEALMRRSGGGIEFKNKPKIHSKSEKENKETRGNNMKQSTSQKKLKKLGL